MTDFLELLSPAGDMEGLDAALRFGADAVYLGGPALQLRAKSAGFTMEDVEKAVQKAHALGKKIFVTVNAYASNLEVSSAGAYARRLYEIGVDAAIVADIGVLTMIKKTVPEMPVHVSTQANCQNYMAATAYYELGAERVVLGREMTLEEIAQLRAKTPAGLEIEAFIHGAMCMSYSGRCLLSAFMTGRSANKGECAQPCRWKYALMEENEPGVYYPINEDGGATAIMSAYDLCTMPFVEKLAEAGIRSFKIEGRMKSPYYVATVTNAYRKRLDDIAAGHESDLLLLQKELDSASHRQYSGGFYFGKMKNHPASTGTYSQDCSFVGVVKQVQGNRITVEQRNRFSEGDVCEILSPYSMGLSFRVNDLCGESGRIKAATDPQGLFTMDCGVEIHEGDFLRIRNR